MSGKKSMFQKGKEIISSVTGSGKKKKAEEAGEVKMSDITAKPLPKILKTGASGKNILLQHRHSFYQDIYDTIEKTLQQDLPLNDVRAYYEGTKRSEEDLKKALFFIDLYQDYKKEYEDLLTFEVLIGAIDHIQYKYSIGDHDKEYVEKMIEGFDRSNEDQQMIEEALKPTEQEVKQDILEAEEVNADETQNTVDNAKVFETFKNNIIETTAAQTEEEFTKEVESVKEVTINPVTGHIEGNVVTEPIQIPDVMNVPMPTTMESGVQTTMDQGVQTQTTTSAQASDTQPTQPVPTQDQATETTQEQPVQSSDVLSGSGLDALGTPVKYQKTACMLMYDSLEKPKWDYTLSKSIRQANPSYDERKVTMDNIIQNEGYKILVSKVMSDYTMDEYVEIIQLHFSANRNMARGQRGGEVVMNIGSLLKFRNALTGKPQTNPIAQQQPAQVQSVTNTNLVKPDIEKVMENTKQIYGYNRMGPRVDYLGKLFTKNMESEKLINPKGPGNIDSDVNLKFYRQQNREPEPKPRKPTIKELSSCLNKD